MKLSHFSFTPGSFFNQKRAVIWSFSLILLLLPVELSFSLFTNSLLLFSTFLLQLSLAFFLFPIFLSALNPRDIRLVAPVRLLCRLLNGFTLVVLSGYLFNEAYFRWPQPLNIFSQSAAIVAFGGLIGNYLVFECLVHTKVFHFWSGNLLSSLGVLFASLGGVLTLLVIHFTDLLILDTILSLLIGIPLFAWASYLMIDAYWQISEWKR